ncbi:hypothetical protein [Nonomuraea jabiensis]|uniref:hypothetical protein n=1 Tax=Nonomuraea jabiensis TaxID=882448 RepID=UPI0036BE91B9
MDRIASRPALAFGVGVFGLADLRDQGLRAMLGEEVGGLAQRVSTVLSNDAMVSSIALR